MSIYLIRHGKTPGNLLKRYIGKKTDESLCEQGISDLCKKEFPPVEKVYASPLRRCLETAQILYPGTETEMVADFAECDFGDFENFSYEDLKDHPDYQAWMASGGELPFPGGESRAEFSQRCVLAFEKLGILAHTQECALVVHGGTIMAIMEKYARPHGAYYDFQVKNGEGYRLNPDGTYEKI